MKTTIDLPAELIRALKLHAVQRGLKLQDVATEIFRRGLASREMPVPNTAPRRVKFPLINCRHAAAPIRELTPEQVAEVLLKQEVEWSHEAARR